MSWWAFVATLLQLAGVMLASWGLLRTWGEYANEGFWNEPRRQWRAAQAAARLRAQWLVNLLLRRRNVTAVLGTAHLTAGGGLRARARIGWAPMPKTAKAAIPEIDRRLQQLLDRLSDTQERVQDIADEIEGLGGTLRFEVKRLESRDQNVAIGGLRIAVYGLWLVAFGLVVQALGLWIEG